MQQQPHVVDLTLRPAFSQVPVRHDVAVVTHMPMVSETITKEVIKEVHTNTIKYVGGEPKEIHARHLAERDNRINGLLVRIEELEKALAAKVHTERIEVPVIQTVVREHKKCVPVVKEVVKEVEVIKEVPVEVTSWKAIKVPVVKIVEVKPYGMPQLYQRTGGGFKVWDFNKGPQGDINEDLFRGVMSPLDATTQRRMNALGLDTPSRDGRYLAAPMATGWSRWTKSHARDLYHPVGGTHASGMGQRHINLSYLDPGSEGFTSGVTPTAITPPSAGNRDDAMARDVWEQQKRDYQRRWGPHAIEDKEEDLSSLFGNSGPPMELGIAATAARTAMAACEMAPCFCGGGSASSAATTNFISGVGAAHNAAAARISPSPQGASPVQRPGASPYAIPQPGGGKSVGAQRSPTSVAKGGSAKKGSRNYPTQAMREQRAAFTAAKDASEVNAQRDTRTRHLASNVEIPIAALRSDPRLEVVGVYACRRHEGSTSDELSRHVTVTVLEHGGAFGGLSFRWETHGGVAWTLSVPPSEDTRNGLTRLDVGQDCPYYAAGYRTCSIARSNGTTGKITALEGPNGVRYARRGGVGDSAPTGPYPPGFRAPRVVQRAVGEEVSVSRGGERVRYS